MVPPILSVNRWYHLKAGLDIIHGIAYAATMARPRINAEQTMARFRKGTLDRIKAVLRDNEKQSDFIREAVDDALERREQDAPNL